MIIRKQLLEWHHSNRTLGHAFGALLYEQLQCHDDDSILPHHFVERCANGILIKNAISPKETA